MMTCYLNNDGYSNLDYYICDMIQPSWFDLDIIREAMHEIEHVDRIEGLAFYSSDRGVKSPQSLSNGMKSLLLYANVPADNYMYKDGIYVCNAAINNNVIPFLQRLSMVRDFPIAWDIFIPLQSKLGVSAKDAETGREFTDVDEFLDFYEGRYTL